VQEGDKVSSRAAVLLELLDPEEEGATGFRNVGKYLAIDTA
jgi:hypothetical protein